MWKNYLKIAWRTLIKRKLYAIINLGGLTVGLASFLLIALYISHENSYDTTYTDHDRIFRINQNFKSSEGDNFTSYTPSQLLPSMLDEIPAVEAGTRVFDVDLFGPVVIKSGEELFQESKFAYVDPSFFELFNLPLLAGSKSGLLSDINQLVLTQTTAERYFGNVHAAIGKPLTVNDKIELVVSAVVEDFPVNSHLKFDFLGSFMRIRAGKEPGFSPSNYYTYVRLPDASKEAEVELAVNQLMDKYMGKEMSEYGFELLLNMEPLENVHFDTLHTSNITTTADIKYLYIFGSVALLILVIACINYINLATAEASERRKEVGVRKVMGAAKTQLFWQFMSEAGILVITAALVALVLVYFTLPYVEGIAGVYLPLKGLWNQGFLLMYGAIIGIVILLSGAYPAIAIAALNPLQQLKKAGGKWNLELLMRKGLVVFQFCVSMFLIMATILIFKQLNFMQSHTLGYEKDLVVALPIDGKVVREIEGIKTELERKGIATSSSLAASMPSHIGAQYSLRDPAKDEMATFGATGYAVDDDIVKTLGIKVIAGQPFGPEDPERGEELYPILINEAALKSLGWTEEEAINREVLMGGEPARIKGIVGDFHFSSLHQRITPLAIFIQPWESNQLLIKLASDNIPSQMKALQASWKELAPHRPFTYSFLDEEYEQLYRAEMQAGLILSVFSTIAIFIACLGLFGLVSYVAIKKSKEISIRKVLGAESFDILRMLSSEFVKLLGISALLAVVIGSFTFNSWLESFAYRTDLPFWIYVVAVVLVVAISLITILYKSLIAATRNPINNLKSE
ncbi:ABC transporter permease [Marivirga lumbricoides]|uniref:ABC transporter permease n=1 Tax=Marivirga lumbricoides TaxID=1046115 RepID=A0ABQ1LZ47_9BACT|nr:ABC transporter permease [Marivirga lumbricoides]